MAVGLGSIPPFDARTSGLIEADIVLFSGPDGLGIVEGFVPLAALRANGSIRTVLARSCAEYGSELTGISDTAAAVAFGAMGTEPAGCGFATV